MSYVSQPSLRECQEVAKALMERYPFLKDTEGDGEVSAL